MQRVQRPGDTSVSPAPFSEKAFYLREFQGRTLAIAVATGSAETAASIAVVLEELEKNGTRTVVMCPAPGLLHALPGTKGVAASGEGLEGEVWRGFADAACVGLAIESERAFAPAAHEVARRLGISKLVWLDPGGGLSHPDGSRRSFVDLGELRDLAREGFPGESPPRAELLAEIERALASGLPAVNLCPAEGFGDELFSYAGSGTLFTRERYVEVRRLGIDDYDAADDLIARGVAEGFLAPRMPAEVDRILANGFGAFVEGAHLAGIGALLEREDPRCGEIASLYTLTRFLREGIGGHLVRFALETAGSRGYPFAFACTTSDRVATFFQRQGFRRAAPAEIPASKWRGYDAERRARVVCLRCEL